MSRQTSIASQLGSVAMTYVTHYWVMAGIAAATLLVLVPQFILGLSSSLSPGSLGPMGGMLLGMPLLFLSLMIPPQAKAQFAHPRAALTPNFVRSHLLMLIVILAALNLAFPLFTAFCFQLSPVGTVALALAIAAPILLAAHANKMLGMLVGLAAFYSTMTKWGVWWFDPAGTYWLMHVGIILLGFALIAYYLHRLAHLREEMDDYQSFTQWQQSRKAGTEVSEQRRAVAENLRRHPFMSWFTDNWFDRVDGFHGNHLFSLARLLSYGFGQPAFVQGVWMAVWFGAITLFLGRFGLSSQSPANGSIFGSSMFYLQISMMFPGMFPGEWLARRRPRIAAELLLPLTRTQYVNGLFAAALWNAAGFWFVINLGLMIVTYLNAGDRLTLPIVCMTLLLTASGAFGLAGVALRTAIWPSVIKRLGVLMLIMIPFQGPLLSWSVQRSGAGDPVLLSAVAVMVVLGVVMVGVARKAWLNLELG
jgi:hypothetical protein